MDEQQEQAQTTAEAFGSAMGWWGMATSRTVEDRLHRFEQLATGLRRVYGEACDTQLEVLSAANECVTRSFHGLVNSRRPDEFLAAQSEVLSGLMKVTSLQAKAWTELSQKIQGCYVDVARDTTSDIQDEAQQATAEAERQAQENVQVSKQRSRRVAKETEDKTGEAEKHLREQLLATTSTPTTD
jgi:hypothetical protein